MAAGSSKFDESSTRGEFDVFEAYDRSFPVISKGKRRRAEVHQNFLENFTHSDANHRRFLEASCVKAGERFRSISVFQVKKTIKRVCGTVERFQPLQNGNVLIVTRNLAQAEKLSQLTKMGNKEVKIDFHPTLNTSKGVIACFDFTHQTDQELKEGLADYNVCDVRRIQKSEEKNGRIIKRDTGTFILTFNSPAVPATIDAYYTKLKVRVFVRNPVRCKGCQKWGHFEDQCKSKKKICESCALAKHEGSCARPVTCPNCGLGHQARDRQCQAFKREFEILKIKAENQISYFEALERYKMQRKTNEEIAKEAQRKRNAGQPAWKPPIQGEPPENPFANNRNNGAVFNFLAVMKDRGPPPKPPVEEGAPQQEPERGLEPTPETSGLLQGAPLGASNSMDDAGFGNDTESTTKETESEDWDAEMSCTGNKDESLLKTAELVRYAREIIDNVSDK